MRSIRTIKLAFTALASLALYSTASFGAVPAEVSLRIESQPLGTALQEFAKQSGIQVIFFSKITDGFRAPAVQGRYTVDAAIKRLLDHSKLTYRQINSKTIAIQPSGSSGTLAYGVPTAGPSSGDGKEGKSSSSDGFRVAQADRGENQSTRSLGASNPREPQETSSLEDAGASRLKEIIVTAQKRSQREQDVPSSLQVLSADNLIDQGATQLSDYAKLIPGLTFLAGAGPGRGEAVLRGISTGTFSAGDRGSLVGIYLDGVPFTPSSPNSLASGLSFDPDLMDMERIEVLEGPQSTLYGASAMGGLINFVTKPPSLENYDGSIRIDGSRVDRGGSGYGLHASANLPLVDDALSLRASVFYRNDPGFVDNTSPTQPAKNVNYDDVKGGLVSLRAKLNKRIENTLMGFVQNTDSNGPDYVVIDPTTLKPASGRLSFSAPFRLPSIIKYRAVADTTTVSWQAATLTNILSYAKFSGDDFSDFSAYAALIREPAGDGVSDSSFPDSSRYSDELRLASAPGRTEWLLGAFYTHEHDVDEVGLRGTDPTGSALPSSSIYNDVYTVGDLATYQEAALFGDLTYHLTGALSATAGVRYSHNQQSASVASSGLLGATTADGSSSGSKVTYLGTISYAPSEDITLYVRAASAYRPGGPNPLNSIELNAGLNPTFGPDTLWNYEAGIKGTAWDRRLEYTADAYHMVWKDVQINVITGGFSGIANAASAKSNGVEGSLRALPFTGFSIALNGAYTDATITSNAPSIGAFDGDPLPHSPRFSGSAVMDYRHSALASGIVPTIGMTYTYRSSENTSFQDAHSFSLPGYGILDLRIGLEWSRYSVTARVGNVTNRFGLTDAGTTEAVGLPLTGIVIKPRTYGVSFRAYY